MRKILVFIIFLIGTTAVVNAQTGTPAERRLVVPSVPFFVPHWYVRAQGGAAYDVGEAKFTQLVSPALQLSLGYKFNEYFGLRGSLSGLWARNRYAYPEAKYNWNFIQPALDAELDLTNLILGLPTASGRFPPTAVRLGSAPIYLPMVRTVSLDVPTSSLPLPCHLTGNTSLSSWLTVAILSTSPLCNE